MALTPGTDQAAEPAPFARLLPGDHACWFFRSAREQRAGVRAFVRQGLDRHGKVLYLADTMPPPGVADDLRLAGLDPDRLVARGQLLLHAPEADPALGPDAAAARQVALYRELIARALAEGYRGGLWITGDATAALLGGAEAAARGLAYERLVERFLAGTRHARSLCQFNAAALQPAAAEELRWLHNLELSQQAVLRSLDRGAGAAVTGMAVSGEIDVASWAPLAAALRRAVARAGRGQQVLLDLTELAFIDGHGVGLIVEAARALGPARRLLLRGAPPSLLRIAEVLRLEREPLRFVDADGGGDDRDPDEVEGGDGDR